MPLIQWTQEFSVGVSSLDEEHKKLIAILNELGHAIKENNGKDVLGKIIDKLLAYTATHFKHEEDLFYQTSYPDAAAHRKEHEELTRSVNDIQAEFRFGATNELASKVLAFVTSWITNHVMISDKKFTAHLNANGIF